MRYVTFMACLVSFLLPGSSLAQALAGNLGEPLAGANGATVSQWYATPFVTNGSPHVLSAVRFDMDPFQFPEPTTSFARVYEDDGNGLPGMLFTELINPSGLVSTLPRDVYTFAAPPGVTLAPNTRYFVSLGSLVGGPGPDQRANWTYTNSAASYGAGTVPGATYRSFDQAGSWTVVQTRNPLFEVVVPAAVPALSGGGLALFALVMAGISITAIKRSAEIPHL